MNVIPDDFDWREYDVAVERSKVVSPSSLLDAVLAELCGINSANVGVSLPWTKTHGDMRLRRGEVSLWAGINGHGKSLLTTQVALGCMRQGERVLIASFEMRATRTMRRMVKQAAAVDQPADGYTRAFHAWADSYLWLYDHYGPCEPRQVLAVARYAVAELGVTHIVIDSLMKVVAGTDDYTGQKAFVGELCAVAMAGDAHVHLVAHARKGTREADPIDKFDVKGAGEIADQVDNVFLVHRNKKKEEQASKGIAPDDPDCFLTVAKQRHGDWEGTWGLWRDVASGSFSERQGRPAPALLLTLDDPEAVAERAAIVGEGA